VLPAAAAVSDSGHTVVVTAVALSVGFFGTAVLVAIIAVIYVRRRRNAKRNQPFSFRKEMLALNERGLAIDLSGSQTGPREVARKYIKMLNLIGEGAFGAVYKGLMDESSARGVPEYPVAVKVLKNAPSALETTAFMREAALMTPLKHPNVLSLICVCTAGEPKLMVVQLCDHGSLSSFLQRHSGFNELQLASKLRIMVDVVTGMQYLASLLIVHRDLAARNVLVGADYVCKVFRCGVFGLLCFLFQKKPRLFRFRTLACRVRWPRLMPTTTPRVVAWFRCAGRRPKCSSRACIRPCLTCGLLACSAAKFSITAPWFVVLLSFYPRQLTMIFQPFAALSNQEVFLLLEAGEHIPRPAKCPVAFFNAILLPCFAVDPTERPSFGKLHESLHEVTLLDQQAEMTQQDSYFPRTASSEPAVLPLARDRFNFAANQTSDASIDQSIPFRSRMSQVGANLGVSSTASHQVCVDGEFFYSFFVCFL
jgi:serine/threonine protein kinase